MLLVSKAENYALLWSCMALEVTQGSQGWWPSIFYKSDVGPDLHSFLKSGVTSHALKPLEEEKKQKLKNFKYYIAIF